MEKYCLNILSSLTKNEFLQKHNLQMRYNSIIILICIPFITLVSCINSQEDKVQSYLRHQYPYEYAEVINVEDVLDSIYDPYDTLNVIFRRIEQIEQKPDIEAILSKKQHPVNAVGRKARIRLYNYEKEIMVMYNSKDEVIHTSLQNERLGENIISKYYEKFHLHDRMMWPR